MVCEDEDVVLVLVLVGIYSPDEDALSRVSILTAKAAAISQKRKLHNLPVMSPCETKNVMSSRRGISDLMTAGSHHLVSSTILPDGLIIALIPVLAHLAIALLVSIALRQE